MEKQWQTVSKETILAALLSYASQSSKYCSSVEISSREHASERRPCQSLSFTKVKAWHFWSTNLSSPSLSQDWGRPLQAWIPLDFSAALYRIGFLFLYYFLGTEAPNSDGCDPDVA